MSNSERFHAFAKVVMTEARKRDLQVAIVAHGEGHHLFVGGDARPCKMVGEWIDAHKEKKARKASRIVQ